MPGGAGVFVQGEPADSFPEFAPEALRGSVRRITVVGEEVLHRPCREVTEFGSPELSALIDDMFKTMYAADGVGLAANQVGLDLRAFVYDCPDGDAEDGYEGASRHVGHILNPVVDSDAAGERALVVESEGCLSVPGPHAELARPDAAVVRGVDKDGKPLVLEGTGFFARCLRHETDHLNGWLYIDRLSKRLRNKTLREMDRMSEEVFARRAERAAEFEASH